MIDSTTLETARSRRVEPVDPTPTHAELAARWFAAGMVLHARGEHQNTGIEPQCPA